MQTSRISDIPTIHSSFSRHRVGVDHPRFPLNLTLCKTVPPPAWASLPTPPMSGNSPPETPKEYSQLAGHRRKRSDSPFEGISTSTSTPGLASLVQRTPQSYGYHSAGERRSEASMQIAMQPLSYLPPLTYGPGAGLPAPRFPPQEPSLQPQSQVSSRTTRKTKAHVASACVNCKKKHLRCDASRPCRRCVQSGKEDTCKDVEHKKRGRPPLKPEDPSAISRVRSHMPGISSSYFDRSTPSFGHEFRGFGSTMYPPILPNTQPPVYGHQRTNSRSSLYSGLPSPYAPPSIAHSPLTASGTGFNWSRPQTSSSQMSLQAPSPYQVQGQMTGHETYPRHSPVYGSGYGFPMIQHDVPTASQGHYLSHHAHHRPQRPPTAQFDVPDRPYGPSGVQLPPIRGPGQAGFGDPATLPYASQQQQQQRPPMHSHSSTSTTRDDDGREPDAKRPRMDIQGILGPRHD